MAQPEEHLSGPSDNRRFRGGGLTADPRDASELRVLLRVLRTRAAFYSRLSIIAQAMVAACIFGGIFLFWYADNLSAASRTRELASLSAEIEREERNLTQSNENLKARQDEQFNLQRRNTPNAANASADPQYVTQQLRDVDLMITRLLEEAARTKSNIKQLEKQREERRSEPQEQVALAVATKVGSVLLLLFFVRVLVNIFRYYARLAIFFQARVDAIENHHLMERASIEEAINVLSPENLDMDRAPDSPESPALTLAKEVLAARSKTP